jgi:hypothetical protein
LIESRDAAKQISESSLSIIGQLEESIRKIQNDASPEEVREYRHWVGYVIHDILVRILNPLYTRHPDLKPPSWHEF